MAEVICWIEPKKRCLLAKSSFILIAVDENFDFTIRTNWSRSVGSVYSQFLFIEQFQAINLLTLGSMVKVENEPVHLCLVTLSRLMCDLIAGY
jgi:hypothetical protein